MIFKSATDPNSGGFVDGFHGDGFTSNAIIYAVFAMASWLAPSAVAIKGRDSSSIKHAEHDEDEDDEDDVDDKDNNDDDDDDGKDDNDEDDDDDIGWQGQGGVTWCLKEVQATKNSPTVESGFFGRY